MITIFAEIQIMQRVSGAMQEQKEEVLPKRDAIHSELQPILLKISISDHTWVYSTGTESRSKAPSASTAKSSSQSFSS